MHYLGPVSCRGPDTLGVVVGLVEGSEDGLHLLDHALHRGHVDVHGRHGRRERGDGDPQHQAVKVALGKQMSRCKYYQQRRHHGHWNKSDEKGVGGAKVGLGGWRRWTGGGWKRVARGGRGVGRGRIREGGGGGWKGRDRGRGGWKGRDRGTV